MSTVMATARNGVMQGTFDDLLVQRWLRSPCLLCQTPRPGQYVLWQEIETGFVVMFPLCESCSPRPAAASIGALSDGYGAGVGAPHIVMVPIATPPSAA